MGLFTCLVVYCLKWVFVEYKIGAVGTQRWGFFFICSLLCSVPSLHFWLLTSFCVLVKWYLIRAFCFVFSFVLLNWMMNMTTRSMAVEFPVRLESNCPLFLEIYFFPPSTCKFKVQANYADTMLKMCKFGNSLLSQLFLCCKRLSKHGLLYIRL